MKINILIIHILLFGITSSYAQSIPDSIKENAYAVLQNYSAVFSQTDINNATHRVSKTITVLDKQGEFFGNFYGHGDKFIELKDFSGVVRNAQGNIVKKIGKKDLVISTISEHLAIDDYIIVYECKSPTYPYTVEYTYEEKWKNGIITYPAFSPVLGFMQSVQEANYCIEIPANMSLRYSSNFDCNIQEKTVNDKHFYTFSTNGIKAIKREPIAPSFSEICPSVLVAPAEFCFDGVCGNMGDWKSYGLWVADLLKGRDVLPENVVLKIKEITKDAKDDREKVAIIYKYLQDNSRYISIQLGIGGFQPIQAASVAKTGFGDCKGLSNWMKAMLKVVDIPSNYCEINTGQRRYLSPDFSNVNETNHAILLVPLKNDSIWLECTNQKIPFGFIHEGIAGHDALVITEEGGKICRLPRYNETQNKSVTVLNMEITEDGKATGTVSIAEHGLAYRQGAGYILSNERDKQVKYINDYLKLPKYQLGKMTVSEQRELIPSCKIEADFDAEDIINKTNNRLFVPICPINKDHFNPLTASKRNLDILITNGSKEMDTIILKIPDTYVPESLLPKKIVETPFGKIETNAEYDNNQIIYTQEITIYAGQYDKTQYSDFKKFFSEVYGLSKRGIVLKKKT